MSNFSTYASLLNIYNNNCLEIWCDLINKIKILITNCIPSELFFDFEHQSKQCGTTVLGSCPTVQDIAIQWAFQLY